MEELPTLIEQGQAFAIQFNQFISKMVEGNEFASALIMTTLLGALMYVLKTVPGKIISFMKKHLTTTAVITDDVASYHSLMELFTREGINKYARTLKITNGRWDISQDTTKGLGYGRHFLWYKKFFLFIELHRLESKLRDTSEIRITCLGRSHNFIDTLIADMEITTNHAGDTKYSVFESSDEKFKLYQPKRSFDSIFIPEAQKKMITDKLDHFINSRDFYIKHGIPYHLGILLHGEPGTGKTSLIKAIAAYLNRGIMTTPSIISFSNACMYETDNILVMEEVDTFGAANRDLPPDESGGGEKTPESSSQADRPKDLNEASRTPVGDDLAKYALTLMLNGMDGLMSAQGRIFIMTTNDKSSLDKAMLRDGRIDIDVYVTYMTEETFSAMIYSFLGETIQEDFKIKPKVTGSTLQKAILNGLTVEELKREFTVPV